MVTRYLVQKVHGHPKPQGFFPTVPSTIYTAGYLDPAHPSKFCPSPWDTGHWVHGKYGKYQPDDSKVTRRLLRKKSKPSFVHDWIKIFFAWLLGKPKTVFLLQPILFVAFIATVSKNDIPAWRAWFRVSWELENIKQLLQPCPKYDASLSVFHCSKLRMKRGSIKLMGLMAPSN